MQKLYAKHQGRTDQLFVLYKIDEAGVEVERKVAARKRLTPWPSRLLGGTLEPCYIFRRKYIYTQNTRAELFLRKDKLIDWWVVIFESFSKTPFCHFYPGLRLLRFSTESDHKEVPRLSRVIVVSLTQVQYFHDQALSKSWLSFLIFYIWF